MNTKTTLLRTLAYVVATFPIAALWHVALFEELYIGFGYFNDKSTVLAGISGLINILVQGIVLTLLYQHTRFSGSPIARGMKFSSLVFAFYFTTQVVAFVTRKQINDLPLFVSMEIAYMLIQFGLYAVFLGMLESKSSDRS